MRLLITVLASFTPVVFNFSHFCKAGIIQSVSD